MAIVTKESLRQMIDSADAVKKQHIIGRALVALYERQTETERVSASTKIDNGVGFTGCDAYPGTLTAKSYLKNKSLKDWQVDIWTKVGKSGFSRIAKYHKQLNEAAEAKRK